MAQGDQMFKSQLDAKLVVVDHCSGTVVFDGAIDQHEWDLVVNVAFD
jgi:hypothetical protein